MVLTAPSCSFGCCAGPMAGPKGCGESGSPGLKHATAGLCLAPLSGRAFQPECVASSRPGWHSRDSASCDLPDTSPKNLPTAWAADGHYTQHGQTGPCSPPAYSPWGAARLQLQEEPVSMHGSTVFKELLDWLGAFGCRGGKRKATYAEQSRKHKTGLGYSQTELHWTYAFTSLLPRPWVPELVAIRP